MAFWYVKWRTIWLRHILAHQLGRHNLEVRCKEVLQHLPQLTLSWYLNLAAPARVAGWKPYQITCVAVPQVLPPPAKNAVSSTKGFAPQIFHRPRNVSRGTQCISFQLHHLNAGNQSTIAVRTLQNQVSGDTHFANTQYSGTPQSRSVGMLHSKRYTTNLRNQCVGTRPALTDTSKYNVNKLCKRPIKPTNRRW